MWGISRMAFVQKSDKYSETISRLAELGFTSDDIFTTMRFSDIHPEEQFVNTLAYGVWQSHLDTGVSQCQRMAEALTRWKKSRADAQASQPNATPAKPASGNADEWWESARFDPQQVDDFLEKWAKYKTDEPPDSKANLTVLRNGLWRYNRNLMWCLQAYRPIHLALLNGRYAVGSRTFKALNDLGKNMFQREFDIERGESEKGGKLSWIKNPLK